MKTYYTQLKEKVLPMLIAYQDDLLKIDRKTLRGYTGELLYSHRDSGTDLVLFHGRHADKKLKEWDYSFLFRPNNDSYYYGKDGIIKKVSRDQALKIWDKYIRGCELLEKLKVERK